MTTGNVAHFSHYMYIVHIKCLCSQTQKNTFQVVAVAVVVAGFLVTCLNNVIQNLISCNKNWFSKIISDCKKLVTLSMSCMMTSETSEVHVNHCLYTEQIRKRQELY